MLRTAQSLPQEWAFDTGLRPRPFPDEAASLLPGLLAATRTGLTPASDDELTTKPSTIHMINHLSTGRTAAPRRGVHHHPRHDPLPVARGRPARRRAGHP